MSKRTSPHTGSTDIDKDAFYAQLEREYDRWPSHDVKIIIGDLNAQVGQEEEFRPTIGKFSAHRLTNENGLRLIDFAASKNMAFVAPISSTASRIGTLGDHLSRQNRKSTTF